MEIFRHTDLDYVDLEVDYFKPSTQLLFTVGRDTDSRIVAVSHDRVRALRDVLTDWLGENEAMAPAPVTPEMVRSIVQEAIQALPLHQSPQAAYDPEPQAVGHPEDPDGRRPVAARYCDRCEHPEGEHYPGACWGSNGCFCPGFEHLLFVMDSPALGPSAPALKLDYCTPCGHSWNVHYVDGSDGCTAQLGHHKCPCARMRGAQ